ncbi:CsgG/HfaB family protein [Breznakiellaceae bacterium SP9]
MKKMVVFVVPLLMMIMGCGSAPAPVPSPPPPTQAESDAREASVNVEAAPAPAETKGTVLGVDLDTAIKEAAVKMGTSLPARTEVALVSVSSPSAVFSQYVLDGLEAALVESGKLVVVDRTNLDKVRAELGFNMSGEVSDASAKSIGQMVGAGAIVTGSLTNIGTLYRLSLKAIDVQKAVVAVSFPADINNDERVRALLAQSGTAAGSSTAQASVGTTMAPAPHSAGLNVTGNVAAPTVTAPSAGLNVTGAASAVQAPAQTTSVRPAPATTAPAAQPATPAPVYKVGDKGPAGGIIFYDKGSSSDGWRYLEAAPASAEFKLYSGSSGTKDKTDVAVGSGKQNTRLIAAALGNRGDIGAALVCANLEIGGYMDWFVPSKAELSLMYRNLATKSLGSFKNEWYLSSSESGSSAWAQSFGDGSQSTYSQGSVRVVRAFSGGETPAAFAAAGAYKIGGKGPAGGIVFYDKGSSSDGWRYLEAAPASAEVTIYSGSSGRSGITDVVVGSGKQNTRVIAAALLNSGNIGAALLCMNLEIGGYIDWFVPSKAELNLLYINLAMKSLGSFKNETYLSSSESGSSSVWVQSFSNGSQSSGSDRRNVRVVRAFSGGETPAASAAAGAYKVGGKGPAGGIIFYDKGDSSEGWRYLEAAPAAAEFRRVWGLRGTSVTTDAAVGSGKQNTRVITAALENQGEIGAALQCVDLEIGGYRDWFLPSKGELNLMYINLAMRGLGSFKSESCWSSSQYNSDYAWEQIFSDGSQNYGYGNYGKNTGWFVRAVRAF